MQGMPCIQFLYIHARHLCKKCFQMGGAEIVCCGSKLLPLQAKAPDYAHIFYNEKIEDDYYIIFPHPMTKEYNISIVSYV